MKGKGQALIWLRWKPHTQDRGCDEVYIIEVQDKKSGVDFLRIELTPADFAHAVHGGVVDCDFELLPENVGKVRETKKVRVYVPYGNGPGLSREEFVQWCVEQHNTDGWVGRVSDVNARNTLGTYGPASNWYTVTYTRYVDEE